MPLAPCALPYDHIKEGPWHAYVLTCRSPAGRAALRCRVELVDEPASCVVSLLHLWPAASSLPLHFGPEAATH